MKITKTLAILCVVGAGLFAFASCKDNSGDGDTSGNKHAITMTVDATGNNIKVGDQAITDSNEMTTATIIADTDPSDTTLQLSNCGKRFFKEISAGLNNTEGFRTNIVMDLKNGIWTNKDSNRDAGAGMLFDFNKYEKVGGTDTFDFFFLSFKPIYNSGTLDSSKIQMNLERYTGVKKTKEGIYSRRKEAAALGKCYVQTAKKADTWTSDANFENILSYELTDGFIYDSTAQTITIGVDVKQETLGTYKVQVGRITYTLKDGSTTTSTTGFNKSWTTSFSGTTYVNAGDPAGVSCITNYANWTHVKKDDKATNLKGGVLVYGFAPYGTKPVATYFTCSAKTKSNTVPEAATDYVGDWNVANTLDANGVKLTTVYEDGGVVHEYVEY